jgi:hypothetical protein
MSDPTYHELLETSWRRPLTEAERTRLQAILSADPAVAAAWRAEHALSGLLQRLPEPSLSSNFTARVMQAVQAETKPGRAWSWQSWYRDWAGSMVPKLAWAGLFVLLATVTFQAYRHVDRTRLVRDLAKLPEVETLPSPEVLQDFDAIQQLSLVAPREKGEASISDEDLLKALQ